MKFMENRGVGEGFRDAENMPRRPGHRDGQRMNSQGTREFKVEVNGAITIIGCTLYIPHVVFIHVRDNKSLLCLDRMYLYQEATNSCIWHVVSLRGLSHVKLATCRVFSSGINNCEGCMTYISCQVEVCRPSRPCLVPTGIIEVGLSFLLYCGITPILWVQMPQGICSTDHTHGAFSRKS
jgi:hypothetical protein